MKKGKYLFSVKLLKEMLGVKGAEEKIGKFYPHFKDWKKSRHGRN